MMTFYYLVPDDPWRRPGETRPGYALRWHLLRRQAPNGGVEIIYRHCEALNASGFHAVPVHMARFAIRWFPHTLRSMLFSRMLARLKPDDCVVIPEVLAAYAEKIPCRRILFLQGISTFSTPPDASLFESAITCSPYLADCLRSFAPALPVAIIPNVVDPALFHPRENAAPHAPLRVLGYPRKHPEVTDALRFIHIPAFPEALRERFTFIPLEGSSQPEFAANLRDGDVFVASGYPEGFGLPPLQAMASGCAVIGFTGGGASGFMVDGETALVAPDGDIPALSRALQRIISEPETLTRLRSNGLAMAANYTPDAMRKQLAEWAKQRTVS